MKYVTHDGNMILGIEAKKLTKSFLPQPTFDQLFKPTFWKKRRPIVAVRNIDLSVRAGEVIILLGANGAGKTTLIKLLCNLVLPTSGLAKVNGYELTKEGDKVRRGVGLVTSDERSFFWRLSGRSNLEFFGCLHDLTLDVCRNRIAYWTKTFDMEKLLDTQFRLYSSGSKKKLAIIRSLLHDPQILFLDEVTSGLDVPSNRILLASLKEKYMASGNKTIIWATHRLEEINTTNCTRILLMKYGQIVFDGSPEEFRFLLNDHRRFVVCIDSLNYKIEKIIQDLGKAVDHICRRSKYVRITIQENQFSTLVQKITKAGGNLREWKVIEPSLDEVFLALNKDGGQRNERFEDY